MGLFCPNAHYRTPWSGEVLVFSPGTIPTVDFYIRSRVFSNDVGRIRYIDTSNSELCDVEPAMGTFAIIVRHASRGCLRHMMKFSGCWSGVAYLMDDDIPSAWRCRDVPLDYGVWTTSRYNWVARYLAAVCDRIWVSTPELARRYHHSNPLVVHPLPDQRQYSVAPGSCRRWGYHGTRVHKHELDWLTPLVEAVNTTRDDVEFELFGGDRIKQKFAHIPRVNVLAPRPWLDFQAHCHANPLAIGLAPLLPGRFNGARSYVKVFDIACTGGVGLFSRRDPYSSLERHAGLLLLPDRVTYWTEAVQCLFDDPEARAKRSLHVMRWIEEVRHSQPLAELIEA